MPYQIMLWLLLSTTLWSQSVPQAYALFGKSGKEVSYKKMLRELQEADVILFGEYHNNPIAHWLELVVAGDLRAYDLGLEMFETDEQDALDRFMSDSLTVEQLDSAVGGLWPNFNTDYLPLLQQARQQSARVYATNTPREYARMVFQRGFVVLQSLPAEDQALLPPLPPPYDADLPGYQAMLMPGQGPGHAGENFPKAQAIKDATMAWFIARNVREGWPFLHINGSYHSDNFEGISWYLRQYKPQLRVVTLTTLEQTDLDGLIKENVGKADYTILVPERMTKTY
ncbi:ChaN family lipoprotein [Neolewinella sp.]|uniref:ChaN family lipoprotein n=1 Tax=Neolewinella sp. TaxID=2993543 RepID=UPI003B51DA60